MGIRIESRGGGTGIDQFSSGLPNWVSEGRVQQRNKECSEHD